MISILHDGLQVLLTFRNGETTRHKLNLEISPFRKSRNKLDIIARRLT